MLGLPILKATTAVGKPIPVRWKAHLTVVKPKMGLLLLSFSILLELQNVSIALGIRVHVRGSHVRKRVRATPDLDVTLHELFLTLAKAALKSQPLLKPETAFHFAWQPCY